jgi:hypothetical protein
MTRPDVDWRYLGEGLGLRLGACVVLAATFVATLWVRADYAAQSAAEGSALAALEQQRTDLARRVLARDRYGEFFVALEGAGIVGGEERLAWAQGLRDAATGLGLPYLRYTVAPRQAFQPDWLMTGAEAPVTATLMELQAGLVHEGDLLALLDWLRTAVPGHFTVTGCSLERVGGEGPPEPDRANIAGACQLRWHSIAAGPVDSLAMAGEDEP